MMKMGRFKDKKKKGLRKKLRYKRMRQLRNLHGRMWWLIEL